MECWKGSIWSCFLSCFSSWIHVANIRSITATGRSKTGQGFVRSRSAHDRCWRCHFLWIKPCVSRWTQNTVTVKGDEGGRNEAKRRGGSMYPVLMMTSQLSDLTHWPCKQKDRSCSLNLTMLLQPLPWTIKVQPHLHQSSIEAHLRSSRLPLFKRQ